MAGHWISAGWRIMFLQLLKHGIWDQRLEMQLPMCFLAITTLQENFLLLSRGQSDRYLSITIIKTLDVLQTVKEMFSGRIILILQTMLYSHLVMDEAIPLLLIPI